MNLDDIDKSALNDLKTLQLENKRLKDALECIDEGFVIYDDEDCLVHCNQAFKKFHGPIAEMIIPGINFEDIIRLGAEHKIWNLEEMSVEEFVSETIKNRHEAPESISLAEFSDGTWMRRSDHKMNDGYTVGSRVDFTDAKKKEEQLIEAYKQSHLSNTVLDNLSNPVFVKNSNLEYVIVNEAFCDLIGDARDNIIGKSNYDFFDEKMAAEFAEHEHHSLITGEPDYIEEDIDHASKSIISAITRKNRVTSTDGEHHIVGVVNDVTILKQRETELEAATKAAKSAERAKSEFLANMSHEIRTPMNGVMGMAELLASSDLNPKQKMFTDVIVKSGASLLTIINDILDFSKIDAGQMELDIAPFNLHEAIEDVATLVSSKISEKNLELIVRIDPILPKMMIGDVGRIRQIVTNLLGNAVKFTEQGHVFVNIEGETRKDSDTEIARLKFSIKDTGIGIPKEQCDQVFNKFSQVDTSTTRKHEGTGLGLSISSSLVELMGGKIGVESDIGKGSTFWFTADLPIQREAKQELIVPGDMTGARILIIDDNQVNRSILSEQMTAWQFDSAATATGAEGLDIMRAIASQGISLDLVILDYQMPEMSGAEVLETMRNDASLKDIPVVMLTSVDSSQVTQRLTKLGAEANLTKPTRSSMLLETLLQVIANKRADIKMRAINNLTTKSTIDETDKQIATPSQSKVITSKSQALDILVAEDNEVNQIVFRQILEETGLNFKIVENGALALAAYKAQQPCMVLMDVSMPEMNGKEATVAIRKFEREKDIKRTPIIAVTAHALKGDMETCIDAGMDDYLSKPVSPNKLSLKIEQWLKLELNHKACSET